MLDLKQRLLHQFGINHPSLVPKVYLDGVVTVVDSKNCLTQMKGGGDPNASGGLSDWLRQVKITAKTFDRGWIGRS